MKVEKINAKFLLHISKVMPAKCNIPAFIPALVLFLLLNAFNIYLSSEAQYGVDLRKDIIPILVEKGFRASKWLGFIIGGQLFYDLTKEEIFNETMAKLIKDLGNRGKRKGGVQKKVCSVLF